MLQSIRKPTTRLAIFKPPKSPNNGLQRCFSTTVTLAKVSKLRYPDEDARKAAYKYQTEYHKTRYHNDPVYQASRRTRARDHYAGRKHDAHVRLYFNLRRWVKSHEWVRQDMRWKTHVPLWHVSRVEHYCHGCEWTRKGGAKLWWHRKREADGVAGNAGESQDSDERSDDYLCHKCYVSSRTREEALPEGYEDVKDFEDVKRKRQLDGLAASSLSDTSDR